MAQALVVHATCPGCKSILRIPGDWLEKPIRCKNCGTILQAHAPAGGDLSRQPQPPSTPRPSVRSKPKTPRSPGSRPVVPPSDKVAGSGSGTCRVPSSPNSADEFDFDDS